MTHDVRSAHFRQAFSRRVQYGAFLLEVAGDGRLTPANAVRAVNEILDLNPPLEEADARRWWRGESVPGLLQVEALAEVLQVDPGWLAFGVMSTAKRPYNNPPIASSNSPTAASANGRRRPASGARSPRDGDGSTEPRGGG